MLTLPRCHILAQDEIMSEIEAGGLATATGESGNAIVKISKADPVAKKYRQVDRLTSASWTRKGDTWTFTGTSDHLVNMVGVPKSEATMSYQVTPEPGCEDCRK